MSGSLLNLVSAPIIAMDIGFIPITDGPGPLITIGAGRRFTTADGCRICRMAGCGFPVMSGHPRGLPGGEEAIIMVGLR
jgi:hypothetical protein